MIQQWQHKDITSIEETGMLLGRSHIPVMLREDPMSSVIEVWLQVHLAHPKPFHLGCCYRTPSAKSQFLNNMCDMLNSVCDVNREVDFLGDLNIDSFSSCSPLKRKLLTVNCNRVQVINQPTRVLTNTTGTRSSTCIDHIFTKTVELCSKDVSIPIGCSDHNIVAISRTDTVPK